ncbi:MAG: IPT/TIG domain-containing protein [Alphaproteobacteria bacterium]|nr:IPT/TIG domain-containing protein [Alphaproteobacteria bacterium]MCB9793952.1 IPT/TIG domain-containing protein [Alphaproteobacteria bacterium]
MKRTLALGAFALACATLPSLLTACEDIGTDAISIRPIYGWADGCTAVKISGHGLAADATATIGGVAVTDISYPDAESAPLDVGYLFYATTPAGEPGSFQPVVVSSGGVDYQIGPDGVDAADGGFGFYYETCPGIVLEGTSMGDTVSSGESISISGCGLDASAIKASIGGEVVDLTSVCNSAEVSFSAPDLPDGSYELTFVDGNGDQIYPTPECGPADSGDVDTGFPCEPTLTLTYGGAR